MDGISRRRFLAGTSALPSLGILAVAGTGPEPESSMPASANTTGMLESYAADGTARVDDMPVSGAFVDYEGWIVTPEDRDALIGARRGSR